MRQFVYQVYCTRSQASFYVRWIWPILEHYKVPKYDQDDQDCRKQCTSVLLAQKILYAFVHINEFVSADGFASKIIGEQWKTVLCWINVRSLM